MKRPGKIILISIDTLRADRLGCYGYGLPTSPNLDRLAGEGVMYPNAFSSCPYTVPTHASLLSGLYPINHNIGFKLREGKVDPDSTAFLQEVLRGEGYATGAFMSAIVLGKGRGLDWGFDVYDDSMTGTEANRPDQFIRDGRDTNKAALEWIMENRDEDLFAWVHYFDVHGPYTSAPGHAGPFQPDDYGGSPVPLDRVRDGLPGGIPEYQLLDVRKNQDGEVVDFQKDLRHYLAGYDNGIKYQDTVIGELFDALKREGIYEESMIIVTADHGEALGENGVYFFHGLTVTPEQSRVPLIIKFPAGYEKTAAPDCPVSTVDIMPTVLDCIGFHWEGLELDGLSLTDPDPDRFVLSENEWQRAVIWREYYLLQEKDAVFDGFCYYFDSQELCRGTRLVEHKTGKELNPDPRGPAGELIKYSLLLRSLVDPKERRIKDKDRLNAQKDRAINEKDRAIADKDRAIADKDKSLAAMRREAIERGEALAMCLSKAESMRNELESMRNSKSWRLTYPLRWVSARLKGQNE